jgi:hypothetical protein
MLRRLTILTLLAMGVAVPAAAQTRIGIRAGASGDPDQFVFGMHVDTSPLIEHLTFRPNVEVGIGDNITLVALNIEFAYWVPIRNSRWQVYFPAGPAANIYSFDRPPGRGSDTTVEGGFNLGVGIQHGRGLFTELKVGVIDSPDIKVVVGYVFR